MWDRFSVLCAARGVKVADVARATGISPAVFSDWKKGRYQPKQDKLKAIADYFGVSLDYLLTGEEKVTYYDDPETEELAQRMRDNPEFRMLFSIAKDATPDQMRMGYAFFKAIKEKEVHEE